MNVDIDYISEIVAKRLNLPKKVIDEINRSQWCLLKDEMQSDKYNTVKIFYIGKWTKKIQSERQKEFLKKKKR